MPRLALSALLFAALVGCAPVERDGSVELTGSVSGAMSAKVGDAIASGQREFTINRSPGGSLMMAGLIAGQINNAGARLTVNGYCASACTVVLALVKNRRAVEGAELWVHAPFNSQTGRSMPGAGLSSLYAEHGMPGAARYANSLNARRLTAEEVAEVNR